MTKRDVFLRLRISFMLHKFMWYESLHVQKTKSKKYQVHCPRNAPIFKNVPHKELMIWEPGFFPSILQLWRNTYAPDSIAFRYCASTVCSNTAHCTCYGERVFENWLEKHAVKMLQKFDAKQCSSRICVIFHIRLIIYLKSFKIRMESKWLSHCD